MSFLYGEYPQTLKADAVTITEEVDLRGYYLGSDNEYYAKVIAKPQDNIKYIDGEIYYFKVEPIKWKVLYNADGTYTVTSDLILDSQCYYNSQESRTGATDYQKNSTTETVYANNYKYSDIRTFLNTTFLKNAFTTDEQNNIQTTEVDNSVSSTGYTENSYACENTQDKIFLLSYSEATNTDYGFDSLSSRYAKGSDYAKARGLIIIPNISDEISGNSFWWLRSPSNDKDYTTNPLYTVLGVVNGNCVNFDYVGVRPALNIKL